MNTKDTILAKLKQINDERAKNRILRFQSTSNQSSNNFFEISENEDPIENYVQSSPTCAQEITNPIETSFYKDSPPPPIFIEDNSTINFLNVLYPIGQTANGNWYIVSECFYIEPLCEYHKDWENNESRIKSVLFHAARLIVDLSKVLHKDLPCDIKIEGPKVLIQSNNQEYDLLNFSPLRQFLIAIKLLNKDAFYIGNFGEQALLQNLHAALNRKNNVETVSSIHLSNIL
ncbi:hypothetical protein GPJ56_009274 [Histomonas meleagridis]|uniref:uncharacterized protein n=1 Tax=Histomonas meleagridis TaxID=135588 RepID=UPI0035596523|nr:hypothetical protein GPJ56_009274 [Histomonas meleagridis]KAH0801645.1 hypothetical protein GO595_005644 [Histomonas meleagridis]